MRIKNNMNRKEYWYTEMVKLVKEIINDRQLTDSERLEILARIL